jgi:tetratricopeptide (TPR) repeat protein
VRTFAGAAYEKITQPFQCFLDVMRPMVLSVLQTTSGRRPLLEKYEAVLSKILPNLFENRFQLQSPVSPSAIEKELLLESLAAFVIEVCAEHPTLILIQDIQWADALSLELMERIARSVQSQPLILGISYRSDEVKGSALELALPVLAGLEGSDSITLKPLSHHEVSDLVTSMLGAAQAPAALVQRILTETRGNPFFIQEVIWSWMEEEIISPRLGTWNVDPIELDALRVPRTMADAFLRRIGHLSRPHRDLLQVLALFNRPVPLAAISTVAGLTPTSVEDELNRLVETAILARTETEGEPYYFFQHAQMKQTLESEVDPTSARLIHVKIAKFYEDRSTSSLSDYSETLAYHFAMSGNAEKAIVYSIRAGDKLRQLFSFAEAISAYKVAEGLIGPQEARLLEIREKIAFCHYQLGELTEAEEIYRSLIEGSGEHLTPGRIAKLHLRLGRIEEIRGNYNNSITILNRGLDLIELVPEPMTKADLLSRIGWQYVRLSDYRSALEFVSQALTLVEHLENFFGLGDIYNSQFAIYFYLGE